MLTALAVWLCVHAGAQTRIWPAIALVVSIHLIPLARVFHVREYYATAIAGSVVSILALTGLTGSHGVMFLGVGMAAVMWMSAIYLIRNADTVCARAVGERWVD